VTTRDEGVRPQLRRPGNVLGPRAGRTINKILDSTRQIFLIKGYVGTTIDEIMRDVGGSRGSFYTYFASKRDVLLVLGANGLRDATRVIQSLDEFPPDWTLEDLEKWVAAFIEMLDEHGSFSFAWTQAANEDEEIRRAGMAGHLQMCRDLGVALAALWSTPIEDPTEVGLVVVSMFERTWAYAQLYNGTVARASLARMIAHMLAAADESP